MKLINFIFLFCLVVSPAFAEPNFPEILSNLNRTISETNNTLNEAEQNSRSRLQQTMNQITAAEGLLNEAEQQVRSRGTTAINYQTLDGILNQIYTNIANWEASVATNDREVSGAVTTSQTGLNVALNANVRSNSVAFPAEFAQFQTANIGTFQEISALQERLNEMRASMNFAPGLMPMDVPDGPFLDAQQMRSFTVLRLRQIRERIRALASAAYMPRLIYNEGVGWLAPMTPLYPATDLLYLPEWASNRSTLSHNILQSFMNCAVASHAGQNVMGGNFYQDLDRIREQIIQAGSPADLTGLRDKLRNSRRNVDAYVLRSADAEYFRKAVLTTIHNALNTTMIVKVDPATGTIDDTLCSPNLTLADPTVMNQTQRISETQKHFYVTLGSVAILLQELLKSKSEEAAVAVSRMPRETPEQRFAVLTGFRAALETAMPQNWKEFANSADEVSKLIVDEADAKEQLFSMILRVRQQMGATILNLADGIRNLENAAAKFKREIGEIGRLAYDLGMFGWDQYLMMTVLPASALLINPNQEVIDNDPQNVFQGRIIAMRMKMSEMRQIYNRMTLYEEGEYLPWREEWTRMTSDQARNLTLDQFGPINMAYLFGSGNENGDPPFVDGQPLDQIGTFEQKVREMADLLGVAGERLLDVVAASQLRSAVFQAIIMLPAIALTPVTGGTSGAFLMGSLAVTAWGISTSAVIMTINMHTGMPTDRAWREFGRDTITHIAGGAFGSLAGISRLNYLAAQGLMVTWKTRYATAALSGFFTGFMTAGVSQFSAIALQGRLPTVSESINIGITALAGGAFGAVFATCFEAVSHTWAVAGGGGGAGTPIVPGSGSGSSFLQKMQPSLAFLGGLRTAPIPVAPNVRPPTYLPPRLYGTVPNRIFVVRPGTALLTSSTFATSRAQAIPFRPPQIFNITSVAFAANSAATQLIVNAPNVYVSPALQLRRLRNVQPSLQRFTTLSNFLLDVNSPLQITSPIVTELPERQPGVELSESQAVQFAKYLEGTPGFSEIASTTETNTNNLNSALGRICRALRPGEAFMLGQYIHHGCEMRDGLLNCPTSPAPVVIEPFAFPFKKDNNQCTALSCVNDRDMYPFQPLTAVLDPILNTVGRIGISRSITYPLLETLPELERRPWVTVGRLPVPGQAGPVSVPAASWRNTHQMEEMACTQGGDGLQAYHILGGAFGFSATLANLNFAPAVEMVSPNPHTSRVLPAGNNTFSRRSVYEQRLQDVMRAVTDHSREGYCIISALVYPSVSSTPPRTPRPRMLQSQQQPCSEKFISVKFHGDDTVSEAFDLKTAGTNCSTCNGVLPAPRR